MKPKSRKTIFTFTLFLGLFLNFGNISLATTCTTNAECNTGYECKPYTPETGGSYLQCEKITAPITTPIETKKSAEINFTPQIPFGDTITSDDIKAGAGISKYTTNVYKYAVSVVGILAAIVLMWGGVRWLTAGGNQEAVGDAKKWIEGALSGLVLVMTSYMILYFVNPDLTTFKLIKITPIEDKITPEAAKLEKIDTTAALSGFQKYPNCTGSDTRGCVTLDNLRPETISELQWLKQNSNLSTTDLFITSGTEGNHNSGTYSHSNGYKVDLDDTAKLTAYIKDTKDIFTELPKKRSDGATMYVNNKTKSCYALESNHWDISAAGRGCP